MKPNSFFIVITIFFSSFQSVSVKADNIDPFEKRILVKTNPHRFEAGLCPGSAPVRPINYRIIPRSELTLEENVHRDLKYQRALTAADKVYDLPDFESAKSGSEFVAQFEAFQNSLPEHYRLYAYFSEAETSTKYMILQPEPGYHAPGRVGTLWILSIAGTKSFLDVVSDIDMGRNQLQKMSRLKFIFTSCQFMDDNGRPLSEHPWIFTGHSLGAGLAQAFAYQVQQIRLTQQLKPLKIELLTFNGFGAQELVSKDGAYDSRVANFIEARNYFVLGEPISKIGHHIGNTYQLAEDDVNVNTKFSIPQQLRRHFMVTIFSVIESVFQSKLNDDDNLKAPPTSQALSYLSRYGSVVRVFTPAIYAQSEERTVRILEEAAATLPLNKTSDSTKNYVRRLIAARLNFLRRPSNGIMAQVLVSRLERAQARLRP